MRSIFIALFFLSCTLVFSQSERKLVKEIKKYHKSETKSFKNKETTILTAEDFKTFKKLEFYAPNLKYRVTAKFVRTPNEEPFLMPTTTDRLPEYVKYGEAHFEIDGKQHVLALYQNTTPSEDPEYKDYLFLPFTDLTSGDGSYGGGRFLDTYIPDGEMMVLNFNKAYNPYCAYNSKYSCPIPPEENDLLVRIEAGIKDYGHH